MDWVTSKQRGSWGSRGGRSPTASPLSTSGHERSSGGEIETAREAQKRFLVQVFPRTLPTLERRLLGPHRLSRWLGLVGAAGAIAAAVALVVALPGRHSEEPEVQAKGSGALQIFGRRGDRVLAVEDGAVLRPGDRLRFAVQSGSGSFVLIGSVDGRGETSVYYPSTPLERDGGLGLLLEGSIVLDDAPGPERVFALFSDRPLQIAEVKKQLRAVSNGGADAIRSTRKLPMPLVQASVLFEKNLSP